MVIEIGYRMADNSRLMRRIFDERVRDLGLTAAQARLLLSLDRNPGENQCYYAERLEVEPITLTRIADRMEEAGWLERQPDPADRRANLLHLTNKSREIVKGLRSTIEQLSEQMLAGFDAGEREKISAMHDRISANLSRASEKVLTNG